MFLWLSLVVAGSALADLEERGRSHLYNMEYERARAIFSTLTEMAPSSPVGPYYEATTVWMREFTRRGGMAGSTFRTGRYWSEHHEPPPSALDREFKGLVTESVARAERLLEKNPRDRDALFFRGAAEGVLSAYHASVEHKYYRSYQAGRRAKRYHEELLELDPHYADACLLPGIYEYTVATLPRTLRFAGFLIGVRGSREKGLELVEKAVADGERTRWAAKLSLSVLNQREKKYRSALRVLRELEEAFPRNPVLPLERGSVHMLRKDWLSARRAFEEARRWREEKRPNFELVEPSLVQLKLAESYLFQRRYQRAGEELERALSIPDVPDRIKAVAFLRRGMTSDRLGRRDAARADYRRALRLDADELTNKLAKRYLKKPFL